MTPLSPFAKRIALLALFCLPLLPSSLTAQVTPEQRPIASYDEPRNPVATDPELWEGVKGLQAKWGSIDVRYPKELPPDPETLSPKIRLSGWRGEKVSAQIAVLNAGERDEMVRLILSELKKGRDAIPAECLSASFVRYLLTDELNKDGRGGCGARPDHSLFDSTLVADPIDHLSKELVVERLTTRPVWFSIQIPPEAAPGVYSGKITVAGESRRKISLPYTLTVRERLLPPPPAWRFVLDLWQNPFAVARYHGTPLWSKAHFDALRPYMEMYRDAGGKIITASIMHKPWNGQTEDYFHSMVSWEKDFDGKWRFDFTAFDRWVSFMTDLGIRDGIACYSMVPWDLTFPYYDRAAGETVFVKVKPGDPVYTEMWTAMLTAFAAHLRSKGWFERTYIAMDERPREVMQETFRLIKAVDPDFKVSLAGALHEELSDDLDYFCVPLRSKYAPETLSKRKADGDLTTFYTSCEEPFPNAFTFSSPADSEWMGWYAAAADLDGYLRWAFNSWPRDPLRDSRFRTWAAGDTYWVCPGARSTIRFERLIMGIQAFEKIRLLRDEFQSKGDLEGFRIINRALSAFDEGRMPDESSAGQIARARTLLAPYF